MPLTTPPPNKGASGRDFLEFHNSKLHDASISPTNSLAMRSPQNSKKSTAGGSSGGFFNKILKRSSSKPVSNKTQTSTSSLLKASKKDGAPSTSLADSNSNPGTFSGSSFSTYGKESVSDLTGNGSSEDLRQSRIKPIRKESKKFKNRDLSKSVSRGATNADKASMSVFDGDNMSMYDDDFHSSSDISEVSSLDDSLSSNSYFHSRTDLTSLEGSGYNHRHNSTGIAELLEAPERTDLSFDVSDLERTREWAATIPKEVLRAPSYLRVTKKKRQAPKIIDHLFLAQELNIKPWPQGNGNDLDTMSTDSMVDQKMKVYSNEVDGIDSSFMSDGNTESDSDVENELKNHTTTNTTTNSNSNSSSSNNNGGTSGKKDKTTNTNEIFVMEFSRDGKYLAVAGRDSIIRVWKVISSPLARLEYKNHELEFCKDIAAKECAIDVEDDATTNAKASENKIKSGVVGCPVGGGSSKNGPCGPNVNKESKRSRTKLYANAPVFHQEPVRVFKGHSHNILSLDWSKNNFLISGSMDRTVRLWHVDKYECLQSFPHEDFVTSVKFHPTDDRFFLSGSLDNRLRLWSILEQNVAYVNNLGDDVLITAVSFSTDGLVCLAGGFNGSLFTLETKGLHIMHRYEVKEKHVNPFHNKNGNKITGIKVFERTEEEMTDDKFDLTEIKKFKKESVRGKAYNEYEDIHSSVESHREEDPMEKWNVLVTTNDSKIRLVNSSQKKLVTRFRGLTNNSSSIVASMSYDHKYIISGSEDHWCYVWKNNNTIINNKLKNALTELMLDGKSQLNDLHQKQKKYTNLLHANKFMRKLNLRKLLEADGYKYEYIANENSSYASFHPHHTKVNAAIFAPLETSKLLALSDDCVYELMNKYNSSLTDSERDAYVEPGYIIVTTDDRGCIRVFRQDVALKFRKKIAAHNKKYPRKRSEIKKDNIEPTGNSDEYSFSNGSKLSRSLLMKGRSLSPVQSNLRNRFGTKMKGTNSIPNSPITTNSGEFTNMSLEPSTLSANSSLTNNISVPKVLTSSEVMLGRQRAQSPLQIRAANNQGISLPDMSGDIPSLHSTLMSKDASKTTIKDTGEDSSSTPLSNADQGGPVYGSNVDHHSFQVSSDAVSSPLEGSYHRLTQGVGDISFNDRSHREPPQDV